MYVFITGRSIFLEKFKKKYPDSSTTKNQRSISLDQLWRKGRQTLELSSVLLEIWEIRPILRIRGNAITKNTSKLMQKDSWKTTLLLAYQSLGVVYGDLSISPLYVFKSTFAKDIHHSERNDEIFGVLSFVFWTLTLISLFKYVFIVLRADDNGQGGTFALYSLICRHAKVSLLPNRQVSDEALSTYKLEHPPEKVNSSRVKMFLEKHKSLHTALLILVLLGTCMTKNMFLYVVFSAVSGLEFLISKEHHQRLEAMFADLGHFSYAAIQIAFTFLVYPALILAYMGQAAYMSEHHETSYNIGFYDSVPGLEAMFADLGHFSYAAIQIAFTFLVYPALILAYMGQAAYMSEHHETSYNIGFYDSVPESVRWPVLVLAILASVVGSQAIISGTFSIINQSQSLGCFPRVKVVHTSDKIHGQIYIPEINWMLMILCIAVTIGFRDIKHMGNATGLAVMAVMLVTTCLTSLVIILCWQKPPILALFFLLFFGSIELLYFSSSLIKFHEGAWLPILLSLFLVSVMFVWHYTTIKKYEFDLHNKVSLEWLFSLGPSLGIARVPGIGLVFTDLTSDIPANFSRFVTNLPAFHRVLVFVCVKSVPVPFVPPPEQYLIGRVGPAAHRSYRCIVRHGYCDVHQDVDSFESELVNRLADFIRHDWHKSHGIVSTYNEDNDSQSGGSSGECILEAIGTVKCASIQAFEIEESVEPTNVSAEFPTVESVSSVIEKDSNHVVERRVRFTIGNESEVDSLPEMDVQWREELEDLYVARQAGIAFILGHSHVKAKQGSSFLKRFAVNFGYNFLSRNCRGADVALKVPPASLLQVGMVYVV
ncbi:unnamed protein product [Ilex paraguariensis]|uniref:Potassium transporter n=1 Tax=Ilex paraguariensis TaxID=185542 RepID=A0ABC8QTQ9_9AQUA